MAFKIPPQAFLSFSTNQVFDTLWRIGHQMEMTTKGQEFQDNGEALEKYLLTLKDHTNPEIRELSVKLLPLLPLVNENSDGPRLQKFLRILEQEKGVELKDHEFLISTEDLKKPSSSSPKIHIVLDNLRSSFNVGSIFRSAEALGVAHIHLCGYTATPETGKTKKSSLGSEQWLPWTHWDSTLACLDKLESEGIKLIALETSQLAVDLGSIEMTLPMALIFGNERYGLGNPVLKRAHHVAKIPLNGTKNSLNVGVCAALSLYEVHRKLKE